MNLIEILPFKSPVEAKLIIPGSKSITNRVLILSVLAKGVSRIYNYSKSSDSFVLIKALKSLGVKIIVKNKYLEVYGNNGKFAKNNKRINIKDAGTAMRFLTSLATIIPGKIILYGTPQMNKRPIKELVDSLKLLGAQIIYKNIVGFPPIEIIGGTLNANSTKINSGISSQFISSLLLISPVLINGLKLKLIGSNVSKSYLNLTLHCLKSFGIKVINKKNTFIISKQNVNNLKYKVESDLTSAGYFFGIAAITGSRIVIENINPKSLQGDILILNILKKMGCKINLSNEQNGIEVIGPKFLKPIKANLNNLPDSAQTLGVISAFAKGKSKFTGLKTLKIKETNRLLALKNELAKMKIKTIIGIDFIEIFGGNPKPSTINTYNDHRMAMSFAMAGTKLNGIKIHNPKVVDKSFPEFWDKLLQIGVNLK
ncbi:MAG: 3-phosphoshikimate 1-carboxyvinyltransferase [Bacteroidetes bacterium]|nr:3-phosphoshikimate 1-carboxyvinyltransferase [Bacteroidota bacterium]